MSLFERENCSVRDSNSSLGSDTDPDRRRRGKEFVQRYLKLLKPLNYVEKMNCSGGDSGVSPPCTEGGEAPMVSRRISGGLQTSSGLKVMLKHLGKAGRVPVWLGRRWRMKVGLGAMILSVSE